MTRLIGGLVLSGLLVMIGCGGLQEVWTGPGAESFHPKTIAVLPPIVGAFEGAREPAYDVVVKALRESGRYSHVLGREQVTSAIQGSKDINDAVTGLLTKMETVGAPDKETAAKLGQTFQAEALLVVKVNAWEHARVEGDKQGKVALGFRVIDSRQGAIVWKGRHEKAEKYWIFKPDLESLSADLAAYLITYMP